MYLLKKSVCNYFLETYHMDSNHVKTLMRTVLKLLGFRLLCPCPYTRCYRLLEEGGNSCLYNDAVLLLDCICTRKSVY